MHWLHTRWPAGTVERLPEVGADYSTAVPGVYIVGDLTGVPLLKFSADSGARAVQTIALDPRFTESQKSKAAGVKDLVIIGAGVSGMAAALEAKKRGLDSVVYEATQIFSTVANFPKAKPIYTYPKEMTPAGDLQFHLLDELEHSLGKNHKALKLSGRQNLARLFEQFGQLFGNAGNSPIQLLNHFGEFWSTQLIRRCLSDNFTQVSFNGRQRFELIQRAVHIQIGNQAASGIGVRQLLSHIEDFLCGDFRQITFNLFDYFRFVLAHGREHNAANTLDKDHFRSREHKVHGGNLFNLL